MLLKLVLLLALNCVLSEPIPTLLLNNGQKIPIVGFGTSGITDQAIRDAIDAGYRHIDTSLNYNESEVIIGKVLKELIASGKVKREDLFMVSKLEEDYHQRTRVPEGIKLSLKRLQLDYLDMYLVHAPGSKPANISLVETWQGMTDVLKANLTRSIGVSNYNEQQIDEIIANGGVVPVNNQVWCNPYHTDTKLLTYLTKHNITLTAWAPIGGIYDPTLLDDKKLIEIGKRHNVSAAQVSLRFQIQRNVIVIPKSNTQKYIKEDIDLFGFKLTDEEMKEIEALDKD